MFLALAVARSMSAKIIEKYSDEIHDYFFFCNELISFYSNVNLICYVHKIIVNKQ